MRRMAPEDRTAATTAAAIEHEAWLRRLGKIMSHPSRISILHALSQSGSASPSEVAAAASVSLGPYAYHMRTLRALGVVRLQRTKRVRGATEHFYELTSDGRKAIQAIETVIRSAPS